MPKERMITEFDSPADAKKVEETVKTGYAETTVENLLQWESVEEDLVSTYARLRESSKVPAEKQAFAQLHDESVANIAELAELRKSVESLEKARIKRIDLLEGLKS